MTEITNDVIMSLIEIGIKDLLPLSWSKNNRVDVSDISGMEIIINTYLFFKSARKT